MIVTIAKTSIDNDATTMLKDALLLEHGKNYYVEMKRNYVPSHASHKLAKRQIEWYDREISINQRHFKARIVFLTGQGHRPYVRNRVVWLNNPEEIV